MINIKKQKEKFLEDYFSICREHGFCIDWQGDTPPTQLVIKDYPNYQITTLGKPIWEEYKNELRESIK